MAKIIAVHSFRGGTGKSNLTANVAISIARQGYNVGIVDTDIQSPGIHVIFGLDTDSGYSLNDYLWGNCEIQEAAYDLGGFLKTARALGTKPNGHLYLIPSSIKAGEIARILREGYDVSRLNQGFQDLAGALSLDYLLIDTHPGLNEETLLSIALSDVLLIILRPDRQDFQGTAVTVDVARKLQVPKMLIAVNKAPANLKTENLLEQVEKTYQTPVAGIIPFSPDILELGSSDLFCLRHPDHPIARTVQEIAAGIVEASTKVLAGTTAL